MNKQLSDLMRVSRMERVSELPALSLIGMAGAGKSTLGKLAAQSLGWACVDTDRMLEAYYAQPLQAIMDSVGLNKFMELEEHLLCSLRLCRTIIATGGSVIYSEKTMRHLKTLGPIVYMHIGLETFLSRIGDASDRALCIGKKSREALYHERQPLYTAAADFSIDSENNSAKACLDILLTWCCKQKLLG